MTNRKLFDEITRNAGLTLSQVAQALGLSTRTLYNRRYGVSEFYSEEIRKWLKLTGCGNCTPVFFASDAT